MSKKLIQRPPIERIEASAESGLSAQAVEERKQKGYVNIATDPNEKSTLKIIAGNLFTFFNTVLMIIAGVFILSIIFLNATGHADVVEQHYGFSKFVFLIPALMNVAMGSFQEIKSLSVIKKLKIVTGKKNRVIRGGEAVEVDAEEIVLDDIVMITAGDQATADLTVRTGEVEVDESMLTGEADHIKKRAGDSILSGSSIITGSARCRAEKIGDDTYAAELTRKVKSTTGNKSELMGSIMKIIKILTVGICIVTVVVTATLIFKVASHGSDASVWGGRTLALNDPVTWALIVLTDGMFGIGMIPTGLVLTTSVALMVSIAGLTKKQTLIQQLYSLENLSRVDYICLDKTGTLTDGTMTVCECKSFIPQEETDAHIRALMGAFEDRNATSEAVFQYFGEDKNADIKEIIPFSSANKYSGLVYSDGRKLLMGAPDYLLDAADARFSYVTERAKLGNRVIALTLDGELIAFIAIEDHIRETAADTLKYFRDNNVTVKVISGDNPLTVSMIAQKCGIENADKYISLQGVALEDIPQIADEYTVFARVSPEQKEALVTALQSKGHKVAMTGDGVNDILALRRSDFSITFAKATDAAKSCSDVILLDNDFSHLKDVVGEGRRVVGNIQKTSVLYLMKSTIVFILAFALIPMAKAQMWYTVENMYMLEAAVIGTGGFLLSLEPRRTPVRGSFLKNILSQAIAAGALASVAVLLPIMLNVIPKHFGLVPFIADANVRPMMTILTSIAGIVVAFSMCIPFNKYRSKALTAIIFVAIFLGFMLPTSYIGGQAMGSSFVSFDAAAGQTIFDSQMFQEMFKPLNSPVVQGLLDDSNNFAVLRIFLYVAVPAFILTRFAVENYTRKAYKDVKKGRAFRIGRRLMLVAGFVMILQASVSLLEVIRMYADAGNVFDLIIINVLAVVIFVVSAVQVVIGVIGYKVWKDPTRKLIKASFVCGIVVFVFSVVPVILTGSITSETDPLLATDAIVTFLLSVAYIVGAIIVRANLKLAREKRVSP